MKKRFITLLLTIAMVFAIFAGFSGCKDNTEIITGTKTGTVVGGYLLFKTTDVQKYLDFLEDLDETKYEIVGISTSMEVHSHSDEFYMVTYKRIAE